jgi:ATP-dependent helicase/nuclease subunit B
MKGAARLFNIVPGASFLPALTDAILDDALGLGLSADDPLTLARTTIFLPTRRSAAALSRHMATAIRARTGRAAALLPRIRPLGGLDEAEADLAANLPEIEGGLGEPVDPPVPAAIAPLRRKLLLARQIEAWGRHINRACFDLEEASARLIPDSIGEAAALAHDLAELIDTMHASDVSFDALTRLDAARFDRLWEFTLGFLRIAGQAWPSILEAEGVIDPADRRNRLITSECERIAQGRVDGPVIAAGSTGSVLATARLLGAIAQARQGAVVLPGLDPHLDDESWRHLTAEPEPDRPDPAASHPQAIMARLIDGMGCGRQDVMPLGRPDAQRTARARLVSDALRPASTTHHWREAPFPTDEAAEALAQVSVIEAQDEREEALAIALALREALEDPQAQAALVTPDRGLAERVAIELARWQIDTEDSAGRSLGRTLPGHLAILLIKALAPTASPVTLAELIRHPLLRLGLDDLERRRAAHAIEIGVLRGGMPSEGLAGVMQGLAQAGERRAGSHAAPPLRRMSDDDLALAQRLLDGLHAGTASLREELSQPNADFGAVAAAHRDALAALSRADDGSAIALEGEAGARLGGLLGALSLQAAGLVSGGMADYLDLIQTLVADERLAPPPRPGARIAILGLLEARIIDHDCVALAGLNETVWPPEQAGDPFLNRPMRQELGLPSPERRVGQSAHDFSQLMLGTRRVVLSRAAKAGLAQTVPSRFWQRLQAVTPEGVWREARARGDRMLALARAISLPPASRPIARPEPPVPAALQPLRFSVTELETLARDPYAVFAKRVLGLQPLEPLLGAVGTRERGQLFHHILASFAARYPHQLPADALERLIEIADAQFAPLAPEADVVAFWKPRFGRLAQMVIDWERERRGAIVQVLPEIDGRWPLVLADGTALTLTARADRIELRRDGSLAIIDFKTGDAPTKGQIEAGLAAQLTLQAAMAAGGAFGGVPAKWPAEAAYLSLKPQKDDKLKQTGKAGEELTRLSMAQLEGLKAALADYRAGRRGFVSRLAPKSTREAGDYDALARVKEWSRGGDDETGEAA